MIAFLQQIGNIINSVIIFVIHGIQMIISVFTTMVQAVGFLTTAISFMPLFVVAPILVSISIAAILFLVNKGSG